MTSQVELDREIVLTMKIIADLAVSTRVDHGDVLRQMTGIMEKMVRNQQGLLGRIERLERRLP